jgi:hypothetical protein
MTAQLSLLSLEIAPTVAGHSASRPSRTRVFVSPETACKIEQLVLAEQVIDPETHRRKTVQKDRKCLKCQEVFASSGPGHRICCGCKQLADWASVPDCVMHAAF